MVSTSLRKACMLTSDRCCALNGNMLVTLAKQSCRNTAPRQRSPFVPRHGRVSMQHPSDTFKFGCVKSSRPLELASWQCTAHVQSIISSVSKLLPAFERASDEFAWCAPFRGSEISSPPLAPRSAFLSDSCVSTMHRFALAANVVLGLSLASTVAEAREHSSARQLVLGEIAAAKVRGTFMEYTTLI